MYRLKLFLDILERNPKKALEFLEKNFKVENELQRGYLRALKGILSAKNSNDPNSLYNKIKSSEFTKKYLNSLRREYKKKARQNFRPKEERGYNAAWYDVLSIILEKKKIGLDKYR
ncbi:MAG: hypothetical protein ACE5K0_06505 [Candidatus Methanofastidiosia archaeon]